MRWIRISFDNKMEYLELLLFTTLVFCALHSVYGVERWDVFGSKTAYDWSASLASRNANKNDFMHMGVSSTQCKAIQVNMVVRHGARFPTSKNMKKIKALHEKILSSKDPTKFPELDQWKFPYDLKDAGELVPEGVKEQIAIGKRTALRFYDLLSSYPHNLEFVSSYKSRAKDSATSFHEGMQNSIRQIPNIDVSINNSVTRFYDGCYNYETQVEDNITQFEQFHEYSKTPEFVGIAKSLEKKLGIKFSLTEDDVYQIYEMCAYGSYISNDTTWCNLLSDKEREILEYGQDLEKYYESSYGHPINGQMACPLLRDIFDNMDRAANNSWNYADLGQKDRKEYLAGKFYFGHSETLVPLTTALGLFRDPKPLLVSNRLDMQQRLFRTSSFAPYSQNVAIVLYVCDNSRRLALQEFRPGQQGFRIRIFVNEEDIGFPSCRYMCWYKTIRDQYADLIDSCNITEICGVDPENSDKMATTTASPSKGVTGSQLSWIMFMLVAVSALLQLKF